MTIFNLEVEYFDRLVKFKQVYALDSCGVPILSVNNIVGIQITSIYPTLALYLEGVRFGATNDLAVNIKLGQSVDTLM
jgi:hypothetical protein